MTTADAARALLVDSAQRFARAMRPHSVATILGTACYQQVSQLAAAAGHPELHATLVSGYGGVEETTTVEDLWQVSRGARTIEQFLSEHGYHATTDAEIAATAWREDPTPVRKIVETYRGLPDAEGPAAAQQRARADRLAAEETVLAALPPYRRPGARLVLNAAQRYIPLRETGKAAFAQAIDGGRCAARVLGRILTDDGVLSAPDDVYHLTYDELTGTLPDQVEQVVKERRARYEEYLTFEIPERWTGLPERLPLAQPSEYTEPLKGVGVSPGVVEGIARVATDPDSIDLEDGEILVCNTTDPSWASLFLVAAGLVIDIGGPMSHGAIVAREMGLPCVINTRNGTRVLKTGDRLRIDGGTGTVEVLGRS